MMIVSKTENTAYRHCSHHRITFKAVSGSEPRTRLRFIWLLCFRRIAAGFTSDCRSKPEAPPLSGFTAKLAGTWHADGANAATLYFARRFLRTRLVRRNC